MNNSVDLTGPKNLLYFYFNEETGMLIFLWTLIHVVASTNGSIAIICIVLELVIKFAEIQFENGHARKFKWRCTLLRFLSSKRLKTIVTVTELPMQRARFIID